MEPGEIGRLELGEGEEKRGRRGQSHGDLTSTWGLNQHMGP